MDACVLIAVYATIKGNDYTHIIYKKYTSEQTNPSHKLSVLKQFMLKLLLPKCMTWICCVLKCLQQQMFSKPTLQPA